MKVQSRGKKIVRLVCILLIALLVIAVAARLYMEVPSNRRRAADAADQLARIEALRLDPGKPVNEQSLANFSLTDPALKINEICTVNTHNSYRKYLDPFFYNFYSIYTPKKIMNRSRYGHSTLTDQLNEGIRGLELDVRYQNDAFQVYHQPIKDNGSQAPNWLLALEELRIWSDNNPNHVPVTVLIEYKEDRRDLNPLVKKATAETMQILNDTVAAAMAGKLITPADVLGDYTDMQAALAANNWPTYAEAKGKLMFLLHYGDVVTPYLLEQDIQEMSLFPSIGSDALEAYKSVATHVIHNTPDETAIRALVEQGYIVRTRLDENMEVDETRIAAALASGAQLLSTDFVKTRTEQKSGYYTTLAANKYYIVRN